MLNNKLAKTQFINQIGLVAFVLCLALIPEIMLAQSGLSEINNALENETDNIIETGRLIANIIVVIAFVLLMLNIAFKVMDNSKAVVIFLLILFLRGLYEIIF